jgi:hypothetical protein
MQGLSSCLLHWTGHKKAKVYGELFQVSIIWRKAGGSVGEELSDSNEKQKSATQASIGTEIELFVNQVDALAQTLPLATLAIQQARATSNQQLQTFFVEEGKVISTEGTKTSYSLDAGQHLKYQRLMRRVHRADLALTLVPRGLLVALVSQFDAYVGALIRQLFTLRPELLDASGRTLTFSQLTEFGSIEAAREYVIEKEIESVLRESHIDQFVWLEGKFNLPLRKGLPAWSVFIEVTERRNLFVHTNGVVSRQYLEVCKRHDCNIPDSVCLGRSLPLPREYFVAAYDCLLEIGVKLGHVLWRKVQPDDLEKADGNLISVTYNLISEGRYKLACVLLDFATVVLKTHSNELNRLTMVVNRAQAYKWAGDEQKCDEILETEDWTATSRKFQLANAVLRDQFEDACEIVKQMGGDEEDVNKHAFREWPLFRELRRSPKFVALFEQLFGEPLNNVVVQDTKASGSIRALTN